MGYETKLLIGISGHTSDQLKKGDLVLEDGEAYRPCIKDEDGAFVTTGIKETYFSVYATVNLCKCGYDSFISKIDRVNTDISHEWFWYEGSEQTSADPYGDRLKPVPIKVVISALKKDIKIDEYRRFKWALSLLKSMAKDKEEISVLLAGY